MLPAELFNEILNLVDDTYDLRSASLVAKSWLQPAYSSLFATLNIWGMNHDDKCGSFLAFLDTSPTFCRFVRELKLGASLWSYFRPKLTPSTLQCLLFKLTRLQTLHLDGFEFLPDRGTAPLSDDTSPEHLYTLRHLTIENGGSHHSLYDVLGCLAVFSHVDDLHLAPFHPALSMSETPYSSAYSAVPYPSVDALRLEKISGGLNDLVICFFAETRAPDALKRFAFTMIAYDYERPATLGGAGKLLAKASLTLDELELTIAEASLDSYISPALDIVATNMRTAMTTSLPGLAALNTFIMVGLVPGWPLPLLWSLVITALGALPVTVRRIEVQLSSDMDDDDLWLEDAVDLQLLCNALRRFTDLQAVHFWDLGVNGGVTKAGKERIEGSLAELSRRGLVHVHEP